MAFMAAGTSKFERWEEAMINLLSGFLLCNAFTSSIFSSPSIVNLLVKNSIDLFPINWSSFEVE